MNNPKSIVIIGGVAGGMSAATRLRRLLEDATITVLERSGNVSFANCGLPYYVGGVIEERSALLLQTPESLFDRFRLDVRIHHEATAIDVARRVVAVRDLATGQESELAYDALVLSPGARAVRPPIPGIDRALTLRDIEDTDRMTEAIAGAGSAAVIGGGFIGLEVAENLRHRGLDVTVVEATDQVMAPLDPEMARLVADALEADGIAVRLGASAVEISEGGVRLADGDVVAADVVVAAIGVRPDTTLAAAAGIELGQAGGIAVDDELRTSAPGVWAVGDVIEKRRPDGTAGLVPLAGPANRQGRLAADSIAGLPVRNPRALGTAVVGVCGLQVAATGVTEKALRASGRPHRVIHTHPLNHAGYYPGASALALKLLVDPDSDAILGAQAVGASGADKRIDVIATAMTAGMTASELLDLDLCYAPQFGSAKDPVNMLGYLADNQHRGLVRTAQWHEVADLATHGAMLLDVRTVGEFAAGTIPGAVNVPLDEVRERLDEIPVDAEVLVFCAVGQRGHSATRLLAQAGRTVRNLDGGIKTWRAGVRARP
ncbi:FAD-dependent oxidoreductase [Propionicicella superfundia]|uniref:FAD-dependent oxidoreductase n=1 Tax=Propionicicella superfundia TaxID=348582 RepID=UPI00040FE95C|nr:FAD-dependent oxidoreductase [Propionicicella superfundia]